MKTINTTNDDAVVAGVNKSAFIIYWAPDITQAVWGELKTVRNLGVVNKVFHEVPEGTRCISMVGSAPIEFIKGETCPRCGQPISPINHPRISFQTGEIICRECDIKEICG